MAEKHTLKVTAKGPMIDEIVLDGKSLLNCCKLVLILEPMNPPDLRLSFEVWDDIDIDLGDINVSEVVRQVTRIVDSPES